jgi:P2-related tail formation protein
MFCFWTVKEKSWLNACNRLVENETVCMNINEWWEEDPEAKMRKELPAISQRGREILMLIPIVPFFCKV